MRFRAAAWLAAGVLLATADAGRSEVLSAADAVRETLARIGGLDLSATLRAGRPVMQAGLLCEAHGGLLVASMAKLHGS